jgi:hypothetical protein
MLLNFLDHARCHPTSPLLRQCLAVQRAACIDTLEPRMLLSASFEPGALGLGPMREISVMTQNLYIGFDVERLFEAESLFDIPAIATDSWNMVQQTNFPERAATIADHLSADPPAILTLQEAAIWYIQSPGDSFTPNPTPATDVVYDYAQILLDELAERGLSYVAAASFAGTDVEFPMLNGDDVRLVEQQVILVRDDLRPAELKLLDAASGGFEANLSFPIGGEAGPVLTIDRGWTSVDIKVRGKVVRVVNTHLEAFHPLIRLAQAGELLAGPADTHIATVLTGDLNSDPLLDVVPLHGLLQAAGFHDAWSATSPGLPGLTWGHDENLLNPEPTLTQRLDFILYRGNLNALETRLFGDQQTHRTPSGLWLSDHAGVFGRLQIHSRPASAGTGLVHGPLAVPSSDRLIADPKTEEGTSAAVVEALAA